MLNTIIDINKWRLAIMCRDIERTCHTKKRVRVARMSDDHISICGSPRRVIFRNPPAVIKADK
jgi:hypothetical protein